MAREEHPREDLLAEARNLVERVSLRLPPPLDSEEVVAGFRRDGSLAVYFGQERVYQFTSAGALRRAYVDGLLYKAEAGSLVAMRRKRTPDAIQLVSTTLDRETVVAFTAQMQEHLAHLVQAISRGECSLVGQVPTGAPVVERLVAWLGAHREIAIAYTPRSA